MRIIARVDTTLLLWVELRKIIEAGVCVALGLSTDQAWASTGAKVRPGEYQADQKIAQQAG